MWVSRVEVLEERSIECFESTQAHTTCQYWTSMPIWNVWRKEFPIQIIEKEQPRRLNRPEIGDSLHPFNDVGHITEMLVIYNYSRMSDMISSWEDKLPWMMRNICWTSSVNVIDISEKKVSVGENQAIKNDRFDLMSDSATVSLCWSTSAFPVTHRSEVSKSSTCLLLQNQINRRRCHDLCLLV